MPNKNVHVNSCLGDLSENKIIVDKAVNKGTETEGFNSDPPHVQVPHDTLQHLTKKHI